MRSRMDRLYPRPLGPRELEVLRLAERRPGITVEQVADEMRVTLTRVWQIVGRRGNPRVRLEPEADRCAASNGSVRRVQLLL